MVANEANWDRIARVVTGLALIVLGFLVFKGTAGTIIGIVGFIPLTTGILGFCPLYSLFKFSTKKS